MKQISNMLKRAFLFIGLTLLFSTLHLKMASASTLYLSPGGGYIPIGGTTSVAVRLNTAGDSVNAVSAFLSYPSDKIEVAWVSYGSSAFPIQAESAFGGGIVKISRGNFGGVGGDVNVATVGLVGKAQGSATLSFIGGSAAPRVSDSSDSLNLASSGGGVYNIGTAAGSASKEIPAAGTLQPVQPLPITAAPKISDIKIAEVASDSATITWQTDNFTDSFLEYGLDKDRYIFNVTDDVLVKDHNIRLEGPQLTPGVTYHFRIKSKDRYGNIASSDDLTFQLLGYQIIVKLVDENGNPISGIEVVLYSDPVKAITDKNGEAVFNNVSPGKHLAVAKLDGVEKSQEIEVKGTSVQPSQVSTQQSQATRSAETFSLKIESPVIRRNTGLLGKIDPLWLIATLIILSAALVVAIRRGSKRGKLKMNNIKWRKTI